MTRILVLPGIGDVYWVAVALEDFCRQQGVEDPEVWVWDFDGRRRSMEYVERIPFVRAGGYWEHASTTMPEFRQSYMSGAQSIFPGFHGFDYYIAVNGALRVGRTVEDEFPGVATDWHFPLRQTDRELAAEAEYRERYGAYIVAHFSKFGMFDRWVKAWGPDGCATFVQEVHNAAGLPVLLTGSAWDTPFAAAVAKQTEGAIVNIAGQTDADAFFALFRNAAGCIGWCGGNTILATAFRVPTLILWSTYFRDERFYRNACPQGAWGNWYEARVVERTTPQAAAMDFVTLLARQ